MRNSTLWKSGILSLILFCFAISFAYAQEKIDLVLIADTTSLDEIVAIGYGTQKKKELTSAITRVKSDEFNKGYVNNPAQLIQGKVSGLSITKPGGNPNEGYTIRLRSLSTIHANTQPLVVIDGVPGASLDNVDPNDIKFMDVLKDGSAAAIYGTRGSSGVIIVTTKKGRKGAAHIDYNAYVTSEMVARTADMMNAEEWRALSVETGRGTDFGESTDWIDEITRTAISQVHNIAMSGGGDKTTYRASFNYRDGNGVMLNTGFTQLNTRLNLTQKALNDRFTLNLNLGATQRESQYGFTEAFRYAAISNPTAPVRSTDAAYDIFDGYFNQNIWDCFNPVQILEQNINDGTDKRMNVAVKGAYEIIDGLTVNAFYSIQSETFLRGQYFDKNSYWTSMYRNGMAERRMWENSNRLFESTVNYCGNVGQVNLTVLGGYSFQDFVYEGFSARGGDFINDAFTYNNLSAAFDFSNGIGTVESYKNSNKLIAFFGRVNLNINSTWFLMASARYEGSSRFGADNRWSLFPAIGGGVEVAEFINASSVDNLKFRLSYGVTGNQPGESYLSLLRFGPGGNSFYNGEFVPGYVPVSNANPDLGNEKKYEMDIGFDFSVLQSKIFGSFDFYISTSTDLLFQYYVSVPPNLCNQVWLNIGEIKNSGLELNLTWRAIETGDFSYSISITPSYYLKNELVSLSGTYNGETLEYGVRDLGSMYAFASTNMPLVRSEEGQPIGQLFSLVFKEIDESGNLIFEDINRDGTIDYDDRQVVGNGLPDFELGYSNVLSYKNWDVNISFRGVFGHDLINTYRVFYEVPNKIRSYNLPKTAADMKNPTTGTLLNSFSGVFSDYHVEDASFVSLDNLSLGYSFNLPESSGFRNIRVYLAGNNLLYITAYKGADPNPRYADRCDYIAYAGYSPNPLMPGIDRRNTWLRTRSVSLGMSLGF